MRIEQGDVYLFPFTVDDGTPPHPCIVLSCYRANEHEQTVIAVMITSSDKTFNDFSFELRDEMFERPLHKQGCHARMHLITLYYKSEILDARLNRMRPFHFQQLMTSIGEQVFNYKFAKL